MNWTEKHDENILLALMLGISLFLLLRLMVYGVDPVYGVDREVSGNKVVYTAYVREYGEERKTFGYFPSVDAAMQCIEENKANKTTNVWRSDK